MKVKVSEASGSILDWLVAKCEGVPVEAERFVWSVGNWLYSYSRDWSLGGPIIERKRISTIHSAGTGVWRASIFTPDRDDLDVVVSGATALEAAMRCHVMHELGDEVEVPDEIGDSYE